jgi:hypothetical protein
MSLVGQEYVTNVDPMISLTLVKMKQEPLRIVR